MTLREERGVGCGPTQEPYGLAVSHSRRPEGQGEAYVHPGRVIASAHGVWLRTVLGSCVSVCLLDPHLRAGGMNHYLLPDAAGCEGGSARFAGPAIQRLIGQLLGLGADQGRLVAKVFGGSGTPSHANGFQVGWRNVLAARGVLRDEGIRVVAEDVGGPRGRRLLFNTADGTAFVSLI